MLHDEKKTSKKNRLRNMILSLIISIIAWSLVTYITDPDVTKTISGVKIELVGEDALLKNQLVITNKSELPKLNVKIRGERSDLMETMDEIKIIADVSNIDKEGEFTLDGQVQLNSTRISVLKVQAKDIKVMVEIYESREVDLTVFQSGELEGKLVKSEPLTEKILFKGAKSQLEKIGGASVTVDITNMTDDGETVEAVDFWCNDDLPPEDLDTVTFDTKNVRVKNTLYNAKRVRVVPDAMNVPYILDRENTQVVPDTIVVGLRGKTDIDAVAVRITEQTEEEREYAVTGSDSVYIPKESEMVKVKAVWTIN